MLCHYTLARKCIRSSLTRLCRFVMSRSYEDAIQRLNGLQTNASVLEQLRKSGGNMNERSIPEMHDWLRRIGYNVQDLDKLNVIHISGTKGKGSTCAFMSSILQEYQKSAGFPAKIGLFTSPHLKAVRERIQVNGSPISEQEFANTFFAVWDRLEESVTSLNHAAQASKPVYFRYLTLMSWHYFLEQKIDTAIFEVGVGGEYDSTNLIQKPIITGITSLGMDHMTVLGNTIESIAWHKAGIMKPGVPVYTVPQPDGAMAVLEQRAAEREASLTRIEADPRIAKLHLGIDGQVQYGNASLAVRICEAHLAALGVDVPSNKLSPEVIKGLERAHWPGRCEKRKIANVDWYLDGAHTAESIEVAASWFCSKVKSDERDTVKPVRCLVFNQQTRNAPTLLSNLLATVSEQLKGDSLDHAIFCANVTWASGTYSSDLLSINTSENDVADLRIQRELAVMSETRKETYKSHVVASIEEAVTLVKSLSDTKIEVLVTGSLHLIGGLLVVLDKE